MPAERKSAKITKSLRAHSARWQYPELLEDGYVPVPVEFLRHYASLKPYPLTSGEALFVIHLMQFKWDSNSPFPSYQRLAASMGVSDKMARRHAQSLDQKGYLRRLIRVGQTNRFNLTPLFDALLSAVRSRHASLKERAHDEAKSSGVSTQEVTAEAVSPG